MLRTLDADFNLTELANHYGSDKGTKFGDHPHSYTLLYDMMLGSRRAEVRKMLEIGLLRGGPEVGASADRPTGRLPSIEMWLDYFPEAMIHGFDISDFSFFIHPRFTFTRGDSGIKADLDRACADDEPFDFIIDDGSHASFHQQLAFTTLFPRLRRGGLYIVEDIHWQSPFYEEALPPAIKTADLFRTWYKTKQFPEPLNDQLSALPALADEIAMIVIADEPFIEASVPKAIVIQKRF